LLKVVIQLYLNSYLIFELLEFRFDLFYPNYMFIVVLSQFYVLEPEIVSDFFYVAAA